MASDKKDLETNRPRRRKQAKKGARGGGLPPVMWVAIVICVVGAVFLFRTQTAEIPTGIGENQTVVTASDDESSLVHDGSAQSGDVDIEDQSNVLTPEVSEKPAEKPVEKKPESVNPEPVKPAPKETIQKTTQTAPPPIVPFDVGPYMAQIGSFGDAANADKEAQRLVALGWDARVKMGNTSNGDIIYRVRIGYFKSRSETETFIRENRRSLKGAIAVHR